VADIAVDAKIIRDARCIEEIVASKCPIDARSMAVCTGTELRGSIIARFVWCAALVQVG
jgi:hypothetical protein